MRAGLYPILILLTLELALCFEQDVLTGLTHFTKRPAPLAAPGVLLSTGGRPQLRELEYIAAAGFKSVLSVFEFEATSIWEGVKGHWLSSEEQQAAAYQLGMNATYFSSNFTVASVTAVSQAIIRLPKPIFVHCHVGWTADLFTQLHLVRVGAADPATFYSDTLALGWNFQASATANALVEQCGGPALPVSPPAVELDLANGEGSYQAYYWAHRLGGVDGLYNQGQPLESHVAAIKAAGYKAVLSFRTDGEPTTRLASDPTTGAIPNLEFSDSDGNYNATAEKVAFEAVGIQWANLPVGGASAFTKDDFEMHEAAIKKAASAGPVLTHCLSGYRSSVYALAYMGKASGKCTHWAIERAAEVGFHLDQRPQDAKVLQFWVSVLNC